EVSFIVPKTVNSAENALYIVAIENIILDSVYVNQNENSNSWVVIGNYYLPREKNISVTVMNKGGSSDDKVMRADAVRFSLVEEVTGLADESGTGAITDYQLFQNYPNPFNPKTVIKFQVPSSMFVKLHVYDILGREAKTLVNEYKSSGIYEVSFDASSLASGLYFYKLTAGNFSQTKKMLLLK
ncbi:MAG: T9SS type A sorting domain-containing protein, partial [Bacteroidota bacterium]